MTPDPSGPPDMPVAAGASGGDPLEVTRRGFFARASLGALAVFATVVAVPGVARAGRPQPPPCKVRCRPISRTGCACGGALYLCAGCAKSFHACISGRPFTWFCLRRSC
jgi:hypothetical protein